MNSGRVKWLESATVATGRILPDRATDRFGPRLCGNESRKGPAEATICLRAGGLRLGHVGGDPRVLAGLQFRAVEVPAVSELLQPVPLACEFVERASGSVSDW